MKRYILLFICICYALHPSLASSEPKPIESPTPHVDERVELFSILFRLAGNAEYNMNTLPTYSADIDHYFAPYKHHPAVQMAHMLAEKNGVGFDAVMAMAISVSPAPEFKSLVNFSSTVPDERWGTNARTFLPLLRDFYRTSKFSTFYAAHQPMYRLAEQRFTTILRSVDFGWYRRFYGKAPDLSYHLILGMNNGGGNYGPRLIDANGRLQLFSIIGCSTHDEAGNPTYPPNRGYLSTIIHEFNHSFVNPAVNDHWEDFNDVGQIYATVANQMRRMAYNNPKTMIYESLVRAAVIVYFQQTGEDPRRTIRRIRGEQRRGFFWMDRLVEKLNEYEKRRAQYPTFSSYMPQIALFYRGFSANASSEASAFNQKSAHVVNIEPFLNHAQNVDPSITTIKINVDKPLDPNAGYSINRDMEGNEHFPIVGKPTFGADGRSIMLPVQLEPHQTYSFVLTPLAFATEDGYPLERYKVEFKTK